MVVVRLDPRRPGRRRKGDDRPALTRSFSFRVTDQERDEFERRALQLGHVPSAVARHLIIAWMAGRLRGDLPDRT